eukprot:scaffold2191_cov254-Pinguiococcus_pyrenoidosus.AAC.19
MGSLQASLTAFCRVRVVFSSSARTTGSPIALVLSKLLGSAAISLKHRMASLQASRSTSLEKRLSSVKAPLRHVGSLVVRGRREVLHYDADAGGQKALVADFGEDDSGGTEDAPFARADEGWAQPAQEDQETHAVVAARRDSLQHLPLVPHTWELRFGGEGLVAAVGAQRQQVFKAAFVLLLGMIAVFVICWTREVLRRRDSSRELLENRGVKVHGGGWRWRYYRFHGDGWRWRY